MSARNDIQRRLRAATTASRPRRALAAAATAALLAVSAVAAWTAAHGGAPPPAEEPAGGTEDAPPPPTLLVFVSGAVTHPGLYHLTAGARAADALAAAGGITADADPAKLPNEAATLHDGRQLNVPFLRGRGGARVGVSSPLKLDLNTASVDELNAVPGMPAGLPEAIIDFRSRWGRFTSVGELRDALGVDRTTVSGLGRSLRVVPPS